jgi:hypothetical protein
MPGGLHVPQQNSTRKDSSCSQQRAATPNIFLDENQLAARHQRSVKTLRNERLRGGGIPFVKCMQAATDGESAWGLSISLSTCSTWMATICF